MYIDTFLQRNHTYRFFAVLLLFLVLLYCSVDLVIVWLGNNCPWHSTFLACISMINTILERICCLLHNTYPSRNKRWGRLWAFVIGQCCHYLLLLSLYVVFAGGLHCVRPWYMSSIPEHAAILCYGVILSDCNTMFTVLYWRNTLLLYGIQSTLSTQ